MLISCISCADGTGTYVCEKCYDARVREKAEWDHVKVHGWVCPKCDAVMSPSMFTCVKCPGDWARKPSQLDRMISEAQL